MRPTIERDYNTGREIEFAEPEVHASGGIGTLQWRRIGYDKSRYQVCKMCGGLKKWGSKLCRTCACRMGAYGRPENPTNKTAIIQAMHYELEVPTEQIAQLVRVSTDYVRNVTVTIIESSKVLPWWRRKRKAEAIIEAQKLLTRPQNNKL